MSVPEARGQGGKLWIVGTPIGNLGDASSRMAQVLGQADVVLCEDTRVTAKLLSHLGLHTPLERCDENVIAARSAGLVERLLAGARLALVSDAGMPAVSDPGQVLVDAALEAGVSVEVVPGPSAVTAALALSGLDSAHFFFEGFLPRKAGEQRRRLEELAAVPATLVIYESPKRAAKTLEAIANVMGARRVALVRELTKMHEEVVRGEAAELADAIGERGELKGECVIVVEAPKELAQAELEGAELDEAILAALAAGEKASAVAKSLAKRSGMARSELYERVLALQAR